MSVIQYFLDVCYSFCSCLSCFPNPSLNINGQSFQIQRLLGEGGFSFVYLVRSSDSKLYALKKIRCPFVAENIQNAMREIEAYKRFNSKYIIKAIDYSMVQERDNSKTVYILLPYYPKGNLQDLINVNIIDRTYFSEARIIRIFIGICHGLKAMHLFELQDIPSVSNPNINSDAENLPLISSEEDTYNDNSNGNDANSDFTPQINSSDNDSLIVPYAHRDIKPANIMLDNNDLPILMDLGSTSKARVHISNRNEALKLQDFAAEHCTLPYRAPELFDIATGSNIDERVDIWSLGCTLFALMYSISPFEMEAAESGASLNIAIINGKYHFPSEPQYSDELKNIVRSCLTVDKSKRPSISTILSMSVQFSQQQLTQQQ